VDDDDDPENIPPARDESGEIGQHIGIDGGQENEWRERQRRRKAYEDAQAAEAEKRRVHGIKMVRSM
jgi:hypothetical protein